MAPGADGAAPHYHTRSDELFYVADGELQVLAASQEEFDNWFVDAPEWWAERTANRR
ncbi:hypothetical protein [Nocardia sp. CC227C]|uniref:hypothetical protein n=1 Tax=Nocardia sp. CC227C TaxID=3044562 RepID=UPI00355882EF